MMMLNPPLDCTILGSRRAREEPCDGCWSVKKEHINLAENNEALRRYKG